MMHTIAEKAFDDLLDQAEAFSEPLAPERLLAVWEKRLSFLCDNFVCLNRVEGEDPLVSCRCLVDDLCVKKLPECSGRCKDYKE